MAVTAGFKQQCPSCEAMVPIKDRSLIGRKIDCPKCKYRFVVEDPSDGAEDVDAAEEKNGKAAKKTKPGAITVGGKKPGDRGGKGTAVKSAPGKKPGLKTRPDDDEDDDAPQKKKASGSSTTLLLGLGLGGVALILLVVGGVLVMSNLGDDGSSNTSGRPTLPAAGGPATGDEPPPTAPEAVALSDVTNLLPNDSEAVLNLNVTKLLESAAARGLFEIPGGFRKAAFQQVMGFPLDHVGRIIQAANDAEGWRFTVIRTTRPVKRDDLMKTLALQPGPKNPIQGMEYFTVGANLDSLSALVFRGDREKPTTLTYHHLDDHTLVFGDAAPMEKFLEAKGKPNFLSQVSTPPADAQGGGEGEGDRGEGGGPMGMMKPGAGGPPGGMMMPPGMMPPGARGGAAAAPVAQASSSYMTIKPNLKALLDRFEEDKKTPIVAFAGLARTDEKTLKALEGNQQFKDLLKAQPDIKELVAAGLCLQDFGTEEISAMVALEFKTRARASQLVAALTLAQPIIAAAIEKELDIKIKQPDPRPANNAGGFPVGPGGMMMRPPGFAGGQRGGFGDAGVGGMPPGGDDGSDFGEGRGFAGQPGFQGGVAQAPLDPREKVSQFQATSKDRTALLTLDLALSRTAYEKLNGLTEQLVLAAKGRAEMLDGRPRVHDLALALKAYASQHKQFPQGALPREPSPDRAGLPWAPEQRLSWMVALLPNLGQGEFRELHEQIVNNHANLGKTWTDPELLIAAANLIPYYLSPNSTATTWWVSYRGVSTPVGATHYVGVAGVGLDAAEYPGDNPSYANRLGVFGYDRVTKLDDIRDGADQTIALLMTPARYKTPWIAAGGSTVRGVSETNGIRPYVAAEHTDKRGKKMRGTYAIMCDGKVRFIPETISDKDFQALCTIAGGENVDLKELAPEVPAPTVQAELKAQAPPASPPPAAPAAPTTPPAAPAAAMPPGAATPN